MNTEKRNELTPDPEMTVQRRHRRRAPSGEEIPETGTGTEEAETPETPEASETREAPEASETPEITEPSEAPEPQAAASQGADSRVPPEARRMAAAPYGVRGPEARRPGTRPQVAPRRPAIAEEPERKPAARPLRPERVGVGYAPGRMREGATQKIPAADETRREAPVRDPMAADAYGRDGTRHLPSTRNAREYLERRGQPLRGMQPGEGGPAKPAGNALKLAVIGLLCAGALLVGLLVLRGNGDPATGAKVPSVISFTDANPQGLIAPADVTFSVVTGKDVSDLRLTDEDGLAVPVTLVDADNTDGKLWNMTLHVEDGFEGEVRLEAKQGEDGEWTPTGHVSQVMVKSVPTVSPGPGETAGTATESPAPETAAPQAESTQPEAASAAVSETETGEGEKQAAEGEAEAGEEAEEGDWDGEGEAEPVKEDSGNAEEEEESRQVGELRTVPPTPTPAPEEVEAPTETPPLAAEAAPDANPDLITNVTVYSGSKKVKDYSRPAKELIHMPVGAEYTTREVGVLTFRGNNFRTNAACGTLEGPAQELRVIWQEEGGSSRGVNQTYYGYGWPGQPAIVRWSKQIRASSNIYETKQEKEGLREVIIAGNDGAIRFLDLDDGSLTRNSIKLGYPFRGTPSVHPYFEPFMSVGQFARKMKVKTGKIGLRQFNLYNSKELKLIDGLDGRSHRPTNDIGSFETSALIDRSSDTLIIAGSNGALYLESLESTFDWKMGVLSVSPSITMMTSKTKGQKAAQTAVESSLAAYDKYVYYADMGGVLRCVDTNTLQPVWAVETGDAVMASVALDLTEDRNLALFTANMLANRKKGNSEIQVRRYDALSGREIWCTDIGVYKGKKDKEDVGAKASPVVGEHNLSGLVYFTVTGLSEDGRANLGVGGEAKAALVALDKETGKRAWARGMDSRCESSPVAVYDKEGNGWIIQCMENGTVELLEGLTGKPVATLQVEGQIEASPAVYGDMMVVGTTGKGTSYIYGIRVWDGTEPAEEEAEAEAGKTPAKEEEPGEEPAENGEENWDEEGNWDEENGEEYAEGAEDEEVSGGA